MAKQQRIKQSNNGTKVDELSGPKQRGQFWISWEAPEFVYRPKGWQWITALALIVIALCVVFYYLVNYSAMIATVLIAVALFQYSAVKPKVLRYAIDQKGFYIGEKLNDWSSIKSFWMATHSEGSHLYLETTARWLPIVTVNLQNVDILDLRNRLTQFVPEHSTRGELLTDTFVRLLRL